MTRLALLGLLCGCGAAQSRPPPVATLLPAATRVSLPPPPAPPQLEPRVLVPHPIDHSMPAIVDANGDGKPDVVGFFTDDGGARQLVAVRSVDWTPLWAAAVSAQAHSFVVLGDRVAVADGGPIAMFQLRDGAPLAALAGAPAASICRASTAGIQVGKASRNGSFYPGDIRAAATEILAFTAAEKDGGTVVDVVSGARRSPGNRTWCYVPEIGLPGSGCPRADSDECYRYSDPPFRTPGFSAFRTYYAGARRVSIGNTGSGAGMGYAKGHKKRAWLRSLLADGDTAFYGYMSHAIGEGRFYSVYVLDDRRQGRVVARSVESGQQLWRTDQTSPVDLYPVEIQSSLGLLVVLTSGRALQIFDTATGTALHTFTP